MPATSFADAARLTIHFAKHSADFGATDEHDFEIKAQAFLNIVITPGCGIEENARSNGELVRYDTVNNHFAVMKPDGTIKTYYKPMMASAAPPGTPVDKMHNRLSNYQYFLDECAK